MTISERMFMILEEKGKKSVDLASVLNVGTGQISTWKKRNTDPPAKFIPQICEFLDVSYNYLLLGETSNILRTPDPEDVEWLTLIHRLPEKKQIEFKAKMEGYLECYEDSVAADSSLRKTGTDNLGK
ncbi:MAG: hypothetical protein HFI89_06385 [Lachnospiraceae bacterium]|nr:hypothetical protein [Lachnospiraceae bacterium]